MNGSDLLNSTKHRQALFKKLPFYTLPEICPVFEKLPYDVLQDAVVLMSGPLNGFGRLR